MMQDTKQIQIELVISDIKKLEGDLFDMPVTKHDRDLKLRAARHLASARGILMWLDRGEN